MNLAQNQDYLKNMLITLVELIGRINKKFFFSINNNSSKISCTY